MKNRAISKVAASLCALALATSAHAQLTFSFDFGNAGIGFTDPTSGAARQAALQDAANTLASYFVVSGPVNLTFAVTSENNSGSSTLASAGSNTDGSAGFFRTVVQNKIITGNDDNGTAADGNITWNWGHSWNITSSVGASDYDFKSTAMHELLHAFGFLSYTQAAGFNTGNNWTTFDSFLTNKTGTALIDHTSFAWGGNDSTLTGGGSNGSYADAGMFFSGSNALAANGGNAIPIYSPGTWEPGSSGSHTSDLYFTGSNQLLMNAATAQGLGVRTLSAIEMGILTDLGYTLNASAVPEPSTYALLVGAAALGFVGWRRRRR